MVPIERGPLSRFPVSAYRVFCLRAYHVDDMAPVGASEGHARNGTRRERKAVIVVLVSGPILTGRTRAVLRRWRRHAPFRHVVTVLGNDEDSICSVF